MGVSTNFYTYVGIKIVWNEELHDAYESRYPDNTVDVLFDGMSGEYIVLGTRLYDSGDARYGFEDGDVCGETDIEMLGKIAEDYKTAFRAEYPELSYLVDQPFKIISFAHWS